MKKLQKKINYQFKDLSLLELALTHRSMGRNNNERLEFLGDSILGVVISKELYQRFPCVDEGKLSRLRSHLIRGQTLVQLGSALELSKNLILGSGELKSGGIGVNLFKQILWKQYLVQCYWIQILKRLIWLS